MVWWPSIWITGSMVEEPEINKINKVWSCPKVTKNWLKLTKCAQNQTNFEQSVPSLTKKIKTWSKIWSI